MGKHTGTTGGGRLLPAIMAGAFACVAAAGVADLVKTEREAEPQVLDVADIVRLKPSASRYVDLAAAIKPELLAHPHQVVSGSRFAEDPHWLIPLVDPAHPNELPVVYLNTPAAQLSNGEPAVPFALGTTHFKGWLMPAPDCWEQEAGVIGGWWLNHTEPPADSLSSWLLMLTGLFGAASMVLWGMRLPGPPVFPSQEWAEELDTYTHSGGTTVLMLGGIALLALVTVTRVTRMIETGAGLPAVVILLGAGATVCLVAAAEDKRVVQFSRGGMCELDPWTLRRRFVAWKDIQGVTLGSSRGPGGGNLGLVDAAMAAVHSRVMLRPSVGAPVTLAGASRKLAQRICNAVANALWMDSLAQWQSGTMVKFGQNVGVDRGHLQLKKLRIPLTEIASLELSGRKLRIKVRGELFTHTAALEGMSNAALFCRMVAHAVGQVSPGTKISWAPEHVPVA